MVDLPSLRSRSPKPEECAILRARIHRPQRCRNVELDGPRQKIAVPEGDELCIARLHGPGELHNRKIAEGENETERVLGVWNSRRDLTVG